MMNKSRVKFTSAMLFKVIFASTSIISLAGCANMFDSPETAVVEPKKTLGELYFEPVPLNHDPLPDNGLENLRDAYTGLLNVLDDPETLKIVQYRLADLEILLAEQKQEVGSVVLEQGYFDLAIAQYQQILAQHPNQRDNAEVLYQLAKSYDLQGQSQQSLEVIEQLLNDYPHSMYAPELYFRKGEILFNRSDYLGAIAAYSKVLENGESNDYYMTSAYMLGWSYYKSEQYNFSLRAFTRLLDQKLPNSVIDSHMLRELRSEQQLESLAVGEKRLVNDSIRMMALMFSYQGAEQSLLSFYQEVGGRHYENLLYDRLGQQFLNEDRFRDGALVYRAFTDVHPEHNQAPFFAVKQIDAFILGDFPTLVLPAKQRFIGEYGIHGPYWSDWGQLLQDEVKPFLKAYLQELAQFEHSKAQLLSNANAAADSDTTQLSNVAENRQKSLQAYEQAANLYRQFIETFPRDDLTPEITFNLAESLFESQQYAAAIEAFEKYAYRYLKEPRAAEAGYAAILAFRELRAKLTDPLEQQRWQDEQLASQQQFVNRFARDPRADKVLYDSMQQQFDLARYLGAIESAEQLLAWKPEIEQIRRIAGMQVIAHSEFALEQYQRAENSYQLILTNIGQDDPRYADMLDRLAASIYKQAEANLAKQYVSLAIDDFLRVIEKAPLSKVRVTAQYDAASYLLEMAQWQQGIELLEDFRQRFPQHPLLVGIRDKLIFAYQQNQNWLLAAQELNQVWQQQPETETGREALFVAAQYFKKAGETQQALEAYRNYANTYTLPFDDATEARFEMSEFYLVAQDDSKRRFWLNKLIEADAQAGAGRTDRSRYLAAMSSMVFAEDALQTFQHIKLTLPLKSSLAKKRGALDTAMSLLNHTLDYKIAEFSTAANYKIAEIYAQLARDLIASERPKGLNALELEQYDILLEEQAYPFEEQAIEVHEANIKRSWQGVYDRWVSESFAALSALLPGRYNKVEKVAEVVDEIY
ncbi:tetratricopeptide repeat protein [Aliiglaciecola sp. LCG003]|uniref:tetratricopeptide repeat protein n=1 Tax=Aliiglaciecola sp. LCG003 TaxID=3053655 RepID=UPI00257229DB|nr:tetratricopeptide repeat protein [Aliiglaciecola sp. LCG003]WJG08754.1 tetratricopeptide repeat protein [Aliiglaciecola sp. LCG003]